MGKAPTAFHHLIVNSDAVQQKIFTMTGGEGFLLKKHPPKVIIT